ncbi:hypothetical protein GTQ99_00490 [Kineococcus sp. T13]|uniref:hypothetical protein n=1 Tax=Kineococcus vitellinus TaxID=2696565 RepID=UPI00141294C6|nr:hypothetical protein [Kineococcus vitellinus]NAZ73909.1 hypothetical protein [Kineococcus vitellinus]
MPYIAKIGDRYASWLSYGRAGHWSSTPGRAGAHEFRDREEAETVCAREYADVEAEITEA